MKYLKHKWRIMTGFGIIWIIGAIIYSLFFVEAGLNTSKSYEIVKFLFLSISALGVLFSMMFSSFTYIEASRNIAERIKFECIENSFEYMELWDTDILMGARDFSRKIKQERDKLSAEDLRVLIETDEGLKRSVICLFNFFEKIELSIQAERVEENFLKNAFREVYSDLYQRFFPWIEKQSGASTYKNLYELEKRWK